jgi:hypothetical protein
LQVEQNLGSILPCNDNIGITVSVKIGRTDLQTCADLTLVDRVGVK